ncbi:MAG TPA: hypothetical protein VGU46_03960 [Acidobacteriaceae bacterium]|nr:hypothetical protein [Acidobacteriaceae bacterium]
MSTTPTQSAAFPASPTIPLTPQLRAAYEDLYNKYEAAIESTADVGALEALNASQLKVDDILTKDDLYRLEANTALYQALLAQIHTTNLDLEALKAQILAISSGISVFADILAAIDKVLTMVPCL